MGRAFEYPLAVLAGSFVLQWLTAWAGDALRKRRKLAGSGKIGDFETILPAALTLLGLIIGFSFSMAVSRYDQRKLYEEAEANAIGTEFLRADVLPAAQAARTRELLINYTEQRILYYQERDDDQLKQINARIADLQKNLWSTVAGPATAQPSPVIALAVSGMNDVLNSQGYTQAAWWNRIPTGAWLLMALIAAACNLLFGYSERHLSQATLLILPLLVAFSFFLIADIDSPRRGVIRVAPQNLIALYLGLKGQ